MNLYTADGFTPLHLACESGNEDIVALLLEKNATVTLLSRDTKETAYDIAKRNNYPNIMRKIEVTIEEEKMMEELIGGTINFSLYENKA